MKEREEKMEAKKGVDIKSCLKKLSHFLPDSIYISWRYKMRLGRFPKLKNPQTFNEKLQWLKIHNRKELHTKLVDKYEAKKFVEKVLGKEYIIKTLGIWDRFEDIDFEKLPDKFVLKCTHDSGGGIICRDKGSLDVEAARLKLEKSLKTNYYWGEREWPYKNVPPRILAEEYMDDYEEDDINYGHGLTDYKFFIFNNIPKMLYVSRGLENHSTAQISFFDLKGNKLPFKRKDYNSIAGNIKMPATMPEMIKIAEKLAVIVDAPFLRIDLYEIRGKIYFSEFTFFPCAGMIPFEPEKWDKKLGAMIKLNK